MVQLRANIHSTPAPAARILRIAVVWPLGAEADTGGRYRETQRRSSRSPGRSRGARSARGPRPRNFYARPADARGARRLAEGRDREMVADHQGGRHQGAVNHEIGCGSSLIQRQSLRAVDFCIWQRAPPRSRQSHVARGRRPIRRARSLSWLLFRPAEQRM
jgi:hypothetical protein